MFGALMSMFSSSPDVETERVVGYRCHVHWASSNLPDPNLDKFVTVRVENWEKTGPTILLLEVVQKVFKIHYKLYDVFSPSETTYECFRNFTDRGGKEDPDFDEEVEV